MHVDRVSIHLEHGHTVRGGFKVGQCEREALPRMVVCAEHATPDALRMVIMSMSAEIERLTSGG